MNSLARNRILVLLCMGALLVAACSSKDDKNNTADKPSASTMTIGVKADQPGIGMRNADGTYHGFDIDVAKYVAKKLGVAESGITWKTVQSDNRQDMINNGAVDLVVASYSMNKQRSEQVAFAGPYFIAGQSLLVRADNSDIVGPDGLNGKKTCSAAGSTAADKIKNDFSSQVQLMERPTYSDCVAGLRDRSVDAVTTDDVILAGYAAQSPGEFKLVGKPFTREYYGIGLKKGDTNRQQQLTAAVSDMVADGSWKTAFDNNIGGSGYPMPNPPAVFGRTTAASGGTGAVDADLTAAVNNAVNAVVSKNSDQLVESACTTSKPDAGMLIAQMIPNRDAALADELKDVQPHIDIMGVTQSSADKGQSTTHMWFSNVPDRYKQYVNTEDVAVNWQKNNGQWQWCGLATDFSPEQ
ncbi:glutamate ABC transporter substrate-binding protein [Nocardia sp. NBC_01499]